MVVQVGGEDNLNQQGGHEGENRDGVKFIEGDSFMFSRHGKSDILEDFSVPGNLGQLVSSAIQAAVTKYHSLSAYKQQEFLAHSSGHREPEIRVLA